jgi:hypothetical protein
MSTPSAGERRGYVTRAQHTCPGIDGLESARVSAMAQGTRAPAHVRHAPCTWVASATTSRVVSEATCAQRRGVSHGCACNPPSLSRPPFPRPSPQDLPEVLPYPILGRLSSTRQRRAAPRSAGLPDLVTSRSTPRGKEEGHATVRASRRLRMPRRRCAPLHPLGCCAEKRRAAPPGARPPSPP